MNKMKRTVTICLITLLSVLMLTSAVPAFAAEQKDAPETAGNNDFLASQSDYAAYKGKNELSPAKENVVLFDDETVIAKEDSLDCTFNIDKAGAYRIVFDYLPDNDLKNSVEMDLLIDGKAPFEELMNIVLRRLWSGDPEVESFVENGNDIRPSLSENKSWQTYRVCDSEGYTAEPFEIFFSEGSHTVTLQNNGDAVKLRRCYLEGDYEDIPTYEEFLTKNNADGYYDGETVTIQAENFYTVSSRSLIASSDLSDPVTFPSDHRYIKLNTLGGTNWRYVGDAASWKVSVPKAGLYKMAIRYKQNYYNGISTHRKLLVNGVVPFKEAEDIKFEYGVSWQLDTLDDRYIYLNEGENTITLEAVLGSNNEILADLEDLIYNLNTLYRKIITITGTSPDIYRDYALEVEIPDFLPSLETYIKDIDKILAVIEENYDGQGSETATLNQVHIQLKDILDDPASITKSSRLSRFKSNISSLGTWANKMREQPLEIDAISFVAENGELPEVRAGFFKSIAYRMKRFFSSFVTDYNSIGNGDESNSNKSIRVWVSTGRDQAQLLKNMVEDTFTPEQDIAVSVELVSGGLIEAILAGRGPDVALDRAESDPVNYAMRNALVDLSQLDGYSEVEKRFFHNSIIPFRYQGGVYGIPVTQTFDMMFIRTDIFEEYGIEIPKTWDELILYVLPVLNANNMTAGIGQLTDCSVFKTLLYQYGGSIYSEDFMNAALDSQTAYEAFSVAVDLYNDYDLPQSYDFMNRFRTGETPLSIAGYTAYNNLKLSAPELNGMWEMVCIPGVRDENGNINNTQIMASTSAVITKNCKDVDSAWNFLKWFTSVEVQGRYGSDIESILGAAGRYNPANMEAMKQLSWGAKQLELLEEQRETTTALPNIPGSYFTQRAISNAFVSTVIDSENPREALLYWNEEINFELERKRLEFDFDPTKNN